MIGLLRKLIREEIGRDLKSPFPDTMDWRKFPGIHVIMTADPSSGGYLCQIKVDGSDELSTDMVMMKDESSAMFWCRGEAERIRRLLINEPGYNKMSKTPFPSGNGD
jgi:hypothetical protein